MLVRILCFFPIQPDHDDRGWVDGAAGHLLGPDADPKRQRQRRRVRRRQRPGAQVELRPPVGGLRPAVRRLGAVRPHPAGGAGVPPRRRRRGGHEEAAGRGSGGGQRRNREQQEEEEVERVSPLSRLGGRVAEVVVVVSVFRPTGLLRLNERRKISFKAMEHVGIPHKCHNFFSEICCACKFKSPVGRPFLLVVI